MSKRKFIDDIVNSQLNDIANKQWSDFMTDTAATSSFPPFFKFAVSGGSYSSSGNPTIDKYHPGVLRGLSSATANSGGTLLVSLSSILLGGNEKTTIVFKSAPIQSTVGKFIGFHNATTPLNLTDGVYCNIMSGVIDGRTANNGVNSITASNYTLSPSTWYRLKIELNADATKATFTLYADNSNTVLWTDTLATNIPTTRNVGNGDISYSTGTVVADLGSLDYMDIVLPNARRVV